MSSDDEIVARARARIGTTIMDKYTIDALIGVGGMAVVYAATHRNKKRVAIKMMHPELSRDEGVRTRFLREGYVANTVEHPGAVRVDDDDVTEDGAAYLVMELLDGETVDARFERHGRRLPAIEVLSIADQVLGVLSAAHAKGIVHRDLKPENLFLNRDGVLKVLDFGIARLREASDSSTATQSGSLMGTPAFMPPEQARGRWEDVDARTDLWAIGATLFTLLTGRLVHEAGTANEMMVLAIMNPAPGLATLLPDVHPALAALVDRALAYERDARFQDALSFQQAVRETHAALQRDPDARPSNASPVVSAAPLSFGPVDRLPASAGGPVSVVAPAANVTTARAVTVTDPTFSSGEPAANERRAGRGRLWGLFAAAGVGVLGLAGVLALRRAATPAAPAAEVSRPHGDAASIAGMTARPAPEVEPIASAAGTEPSAPEVVAPAPPSAPTPKAAPARRTSAGAATPPATAAATPAPAPAPKTKGDPLSKRR